MRERITTVYGALALLWAALVVLQVFFAGLGIFGAASYDTHKAFGIHFVTFLVAFTVMCSGITSASTASNAFAANLADGFGLDDADRAAVEHDALDGLVQALRAFDELRQRLRDELATAPGPAVIAVHERLLRGDGPPPEALIATALRAARP